MRIVVALVVAALVVGVGFDIGAAALFAAFGADDLGDAEGFRVKRRLRDEAVGEGEAEDPGYARGETEQEDVPVEACGLLEGELSALGNEGGDCNGGGSAMLTQEQNKKVNVPFNRKGINEMATNHCDRTKRGWSAARRREWPRRYP